MRRTTLLAFAAIAAIAAAPSAQAHNGHGTWHGKGKGVPAGTVIASGLANPRGMNFDKHGDLWIAEAGSGAFVNGATPAGATCFPGEEGGNSCFGTTGAFTRVHAGSQERVVTGLPSIGDQTTGGSALGASDILPDGHHVVGLIGAGGNPTDRAQLEAVDPAAGLFGHIVKVNPWNGTVWPFADFVQYEATNNPDKNTEEGGVDSDAYGLLARHGGYVVADAGGNDVLSVKHKQITTLATFASTLVPAPPFIQPPPPGGMIPMQAVPTSVAMRPHDPDLYVGQLTGFPFVPGAANVYRIKPDGTTEVFASGFTNIVDIAWGRNGSLYVLEISANGLASDNPGPGALYRVSADGTSRTLVAGDGLVSPTAVAFGKDGTVYVSNNGMSATDGEVISLGKV
jgi:hypothetical protein